MTKLDWLVFFSWLIFLTSYGLYRGRGSSSTEKFLLAGRTMPWYAMGLSIIATQASAITFISTTGQGYIDGLRFVQFYFGLPIAMVLVAAFAVPVFRRARVFTAYEYLERRFDAKTRALVSIVFLIQRGLGAGIGLYAPAVALSAVLGWPDRWTTVLIGALVILYTTMGGIKALTWADVQQMMMIFIALGISLFVALHAMPHGIGFMDALHLAGATHRMRIVDTSLDWSNRYNLWSGLIGGGFLALAYFGCDQSQVQRYLTGRSLKASRLSLLFTGVAKIPMQLLILFIGAMVFVLSMFVQPPVAFDPVQAKHVEALSQWPDLKQQYDHAFVARQKAAFAFAAAARQGNASPTALRSAETGFNQVRSKIVRTAGNFDDTNYIFLSFVARYLPVGLVGLLIAVIFSASMGSSSGEINSLATVSVIDIYKRYVNRNGTDLHYVFASRAFTVFWGAYAVGFAIWGARGFGALIERVNIVGSLFYGGLLGVFVLAFFFPRVKGTAAFVGVLAGEAAIFSVAAFTPLSFLWYNVVGCFVVVGTALALTAVGPEARARISARPSD